MHQNTMSPIQFLAFCACSVAFSNVPFTAFAGESVLFAFNGGNDGSVPTGPLLNVNGVFYGMTNAGGTNGYGTIFSLTPAGVKTTLYSFRGGADGANPIGGLIAADGILYGNTQLGGSTAAACGPTGCGAVFSITPSGVETVVATLPGGNGPYLPAFGGLVNISSIFYGTTYLGGGSQNCGPGFGCGTIYSVTRHGRLATVYAFQGAEDGAFPQSTLARVDATLYGTTDSSGANNEGTVFSVSTTGAETTLYSFRRGDNPKDSNTSLSYLGGSFYGTTQQGTKNQGTAFVLRPSGALKELHLFGGPGDGNLPQSLMRIGQTFYGVASQGGATGNGTIFSLSKTGAETQLYSFAGGRDASVPNSTLINVGGIFYGTSTNGGGSKNCKGGCGTVFTYTP